MKYKAFISYSHAQDKNFSPVLQRSLETFAKKWHQIRRIRVFRDESNLTVTPSLWSSIEESLENSEYFIYLASPEAAESLWVKKEIKWWMDNKDKKNFLIVLTSGTIIWDNITNDFNKVTSTAISHELFGQFHDEPLYLDLRWIKNSKINVSSSSAKFQSEVAILASVLLNEDKDNLIGYNAQQIEIRKKFLQTTVSTLILLLIITLLSSYFAFYQKNEAIVQTKIAIEEKNKAIEAKRKAIYEKNKASEYLKQSKENEKIAKENLCKSLIQQGVDEKNINPLKSKLVIGNAVSKCINDNKKISRILYNSFIDVKLENYFNPENSFIDEVVFDKKSILFIESNSGSIYEIKKGVVRKLIQGDYSPDSPFYMGSRKNIPKSSVNYSSSYSEINRKNLHVVSWGEDGLVKLWSRLGKLKQTVLKHNSGVIGVVFGFSIKDMIISWDVSGDIKIYHKRNITTLHSKNVYRVLKIINNNIFMTINSVSELKMWDIDRKVYKKIANNVDSIFVLEKQQGVVIFYNNGLSQYFDLQTKKFITIKENKNYRKAFVFEDKNKIFLWGENSLDFWDTKKHIVENIITETNEISFVSFNPSNLNFVYIVNNMVKYINISKLPIVKTNIISFDRKAQGALILGDSINIVSWGDNNVIKIIINNKKFILKHQEGIKIAQVYFNKKTNQLVSVDFTGNIMVWKIVKSYNRKNIALNSILSIHYSTNLPLGINNIEFKSNGKCVELHKDNNIENIICFDKGIVEGIKFNKNKNELLAWGGDGTVRLWDRGNMNSKVIITYGSIVNGAKYINDSNDIVSWSEKGIIKLWKRSDSTTKIIKTHHIGSIGGITLSNKSSNMLSYDHKGMLFLSSLKTGRSKLISMHKKDIWGAIFNHDESEVLSWSLDGSVKIWNKAANKSKEIINHNGLAIGARYGKIFNEVVSWSATSDNVKLWDRFTSRTKVIIEHTENVRGVIYNKYETELLSWSVDGKLKLWDRGISAIKAVYDHGEMVRGANYSNNGELIVSWGLRKIKVWDKKTRILLATYNVISFIRSVKFNAQDNKIIVDNISFIKEFPLYKFKEDIVSSNFYPKLSHVETGSYLDSTGEIKVLSINKWIKEKHEINKLQKEYNLNSAVKEK